MQTTKKYLRTYFKEKRTALTERERLRLNDLLLIQFQQVPFPQKLNKVLTYCAIDRHAEVNSDTMTAFLQFRIPGLEIAYPVANFEDHTMKVVLVQDDTQFALNAYGIAEPVNGTEIAAGELDMVMVPLLAFDKNGYRVGYGKGFYDRFLAGCRSDVFKLGCSFFDPVDRIEDINQFDVPLNTGITPDAIYEF